ncbi:MAG: carboxylate--amine ligase [Terriglobia bacterium]
MNTSTPVVVLRSDGHGGLNIMRSLGRLGVAVYNVDPDHWAPTYSSVYCRGKFLWDVERQPGPLSVDYLLRAARSIGRRAILIPTTDRTAVFVADHAEQLKAWYAFPEQPAGLARQLRDKMEMHLLARRVGIPTPETIAPRSRNEVLRFLESATFPVMLKAIDSQRSFDKFRKKMFIVKTPQELLEKYDALEDPADPVFLIQEYIPGGDDSIWMFNGYFNADSECLIAFTGKKIRQCPIHTGSTSLGICQWNPAVDELTRHFMKAVRYRGILDIGFRYDERDGKYKVLDVNPRIGATFRLFVADGGMDVARALYLDLTGQEVPRSSAPDGRKWMVEDLDLASCGRYYLEGALTFGQWVSSLRGIQEAAYFAWDDPKPFLTMLAVRSVEVMRRLSRLLATAARRWTLRARARWLALRLVGRASVRPPIGPPTLKSEGGR